MEDKSMKVLALVALALMIQLHRIGVLAAPRGVAAVAVEQGGHPPVPDVLPDVRLANWSNGLSGRRSLRMSAIIG